MLDSPAAGPTELDGAPLDSAGVAAAAAGPVRVTLSAAARARATASFHQARRAAGTRAVYGRSTGVGANRSVALEVPDEAVDGDPATPDPATPDAVAMALLRSHATSAGGPRSARRVRAMLVIRLNQLAAGGSGADPRLLDALAAAVSADALPPVLELGGIGTGDLPAMARAALALAGELPTSSPLPAPYVFGRHDALPFLSSSAATLADAALAGDELTRLARAALTVAALTFTATRGNAEAFSPAAQRAAPFPGAHRVVVGLRALLEALPDPAQEPPARLQDPYALRTLPTVHGSHLDALARLDDVVAASTGAPSENPVVLPDADGGLAHHGGFHVAGLASALDAVRSGAAQSAQLSTARLAMLVEPSRTDLHAFLGDGTPAASGVMMVEYVAASALAQLRSLATPAAVQTATLSRGLEEDASFASLAAQQALASACAYRTVVACELLAAVRALRQQHRVPAAIAPLVTDLPVAMADRDLTDDLARAHDLLDRLDALVPDGA